MAPSRKQKSLRKNLNLEGPVTVVIHQDEREAAPPGSKEKILCAE